MRTGISFQSFSSGSCGNCYLLGSADSGGRMSDAVIIDAGVSPRTVKRVMTSEGLDTGCIRAVLVTHDHCDHIRSLGSFCKHFHLPVIVPERLGDILSSHPLTRDHFSEVRSDIAPGEKREIIGGRLYASFFEVPHDAGYTVGYDILFDNHRFVIATDCGAVTDELMRAASSAGTVVIESNYDEDMLFDGNYPEELKERIAGGHGHISNAECADAVRGFLHEGLKNVFLCHLSQNNNTRELALESALKAVEDAPVRVIALPRETPSPLFNL
ncbi:MAG: MBL fold metallo-hydrolase [Bacteroidales bacterium]|nr:MBL fold metallo-hydrolase [Bacteroidales bacterium]